MFLLFCLTACGGTAFEFSDLDKLGNNTPVNDDTKEPVAIHKPPLISVLSAGGSHSLAINSAGELYAWGYNYFRQLGDGTTTNKTSAVKIGTSTNNTNWVKVATGGNHSLAINAVGELYAWGANNHGQLGDGTNINKGSPVKIGSAVNWVGVAAGANHSLAINKAGELYAWGWNDRGQLGNGTTGVTASSNAIPVRITRPVTICSISTISEITYRTHCPTNWVMVAAGDHHSLALSRGGEIYAWGGNSVGQLGDGTTADKHRPVKMNSTIHWKKIFAGSAHNMAINADGELYAWGWNNQGQLGDGTTTVKTSLVKIGSATNWAGVSLGGNRSLAINTDGELYAWGANHYGQLGDGTYVDKHSPVQIGTSTNNTNWVEIATGNHHSLALNSAGEVYAWGLNDAGQLGNGTSGNKGSPVQIDTSTNWNKIVAGDYHNLAINSDGELYAWGANLYGRLGDGTTADKHSPVQIGTATNWKMVSAGGGHSLAINEEGELYAWGKNYSGQVGDGTSSISSNRASPVKICITTTNCPANWVKVAAGDDHSLAINSDRKLYAWGHNNQGQLGNGSTYGRRNRPTQIGTAANWKMVSAGAGYSLAINEEGKLYAWGSHGYGRLGIGRQPARIIFPRPRQVGTATNWVTVVAGHYHSLAINADGELYAWGWNGSGSVGDGTTTFKLSPVKIGIASNWAKVAMVGSHSLAINSAGELYTWGQNNVGQLGNGTSVDKNSLVKIGIASNWAGVAAGYNHSLAINTAGELYAWGQNQYGQLGNGGTNANANKTTPALVKIQP